MLPPLSWGFPPFRFDPTSMSLWRHDQLVPLPPKSLAILATLVAHAGQVVTKEALLDAVWPETAVTEGVLKGCISQIHRALGETAETPQFIATVHRRGYRFIAPATPVKDPAPHELSTASWQLPLSPSLPETPPVFLVGREAELAQLQAWWVRARQGTRQLVFITGEGGIGKTTLVDTFVAQVAGGDAVRIIRGQCIEHYGVGEAYLPLLEALTDLGQSPDGVQLHALLWQRAPHWLLQLPALVSDTEIERLQRRASGTTRERMLRELAEAMETLTAEHPLVLVLEDLHWSDGATLDWLAYMARRRHAARLLVLGTYRPADAVTQGHPIHTVTQDLLLHGQGFELTLGYLPRVAVAAYLAWRFGEGRLPAALVDTLHQRTDGNPLFLIAVIDALVQQGTLREETTGWRLIGDAEATVMGLPAGLRQIIEQRLGQLAPAEQQLLEAASVAGKEFAAAAVAAVVGTDVETVENYCQALVRQGQFLRSLGHVDWPDGTVSGRYGYIHDLYREMIYDRVPASRQVRWHQQIGLRLEVGYGPKAHEVAAELAEHFVRGRDLRRAVYYLRYAGEQALQRNAHQEARAHFYKGLELLQMLPDIPERQRQELTLHLLLGVALTATDGSAAADVGHAYTRAWALCQQIEEMPQRFSILAGLWRFYSVRGQLQTGRELVEQLLNLAREGDNPLLLMEAHFAVGNTMLWLGAFAKAHEHLAQSIALATPHQQHSLAFLHGQDPGVCCRSFAACTLWYLGYPDQALTQSHAAITLAQEQLHAYSLALALNFVVELHQLRQEPQNVQGGVLTLLSLSEEQGFALWSARGALLHGWALAKQHQDAQGIAQIQQGLAAYQATGAKRGRPYYLLLLAEAYGTMGQLELWLATLTEALEMVHETGERLYEAELYRLRGALLLALWPDHRVDAETCFQHALTIAQEQQAKSWELRAATSLARLWQAQDERQEAYDLLAPVYDWFTEGFDTADLREAKGLLEELA